MSENTQTDDLAAIRTADIVLGETTYSVREASHRRSKRLWPILLDQIKPAMETLKETEGLSNESTLSDLGALVPVLERVLLEVPDAIVDFICTYDDALEAARDSIEDTATQRQLLLALLALLEMSDPFGLRKLVSRGLSRRAPGSSSAPASGE